MLRSRHAGKPAFGRSTDDVVGVAGDAIDDHVDGSGREFPVVIVRADAQ